MRAALPAALLLVCPLAAQQTIGSLPAADATVAGDLSLADGQALLVGSSTVLAKDHTARVSLSRGGTVSLCATSSLHLSQSQTSSAPPALMLALDRGALEVHTVAQANDVLLTPDLRFTLRAAGPLDLRVRVTPDGDTCVEHRGESAPRLTIADPFTDATYELHAGQHVLFEHGSLKQVVDHESSPCGCPPADTKPGVSLAEALLTPGTPGTSAADQHPFPVAVSQGLAPAPAVPAAPSGVAHAQVAATLGYSAEPATPIPPPSSAQTPAAVQTPHANRNVAQRVGHFFKRLFGG